MAQGLDVLTSINITRVVKKLVDINTLPQNLLFYNRATKVQAGDDEITMREESQVFAADIVSTDSRAQIRDSGQVTFETSRIAKIKHGFGLSESQMQTLNRIERSQSSGTDLWTFESYVARNTANLVLGIQQRIETMLIGMLLDGYTYDRLGIRVSGTWGMPGTYKVTPSTEWDSTSSTPITDILTMKAYALVTHGETLNRVTMSYKTLKYIIATTEFRALYKALNFTWNVDDAAIITADVNRYATVVGTMLGMTLEVYDGMYREFNSSGAINTPVRFLPENLVLFTNTADDNSGAGWDFAQGVIMETLIGKLGGTSVYGGFPDASFGPVAYATQADPSLNPPGITVWAVDRGAPRKMRQTCSAKLTAWT